MDIKVVENGISYLCIVDEDDIYAYINKNEDNMICLDDEQKILKAIYEMWVKDKYFLQCISYDIPENSPHYGKRQYYIENISPNDIIWNDEEIPSKILNRAKIKLTCTRMIEKTLGIDGICIGIDIVGNFYIVIDGNTSLYFNRKDLNFKDGSFYEKYRLKKNRHQIIERVHDAIHKNINIIKDLYSAYYE